MPQKARGPSCWRRFTRSRSRASSSTAIRSANGPRRSSAATRWHFSAQQAPVWPDLVPWQYSGMNGVALRRILPPATVFVGFLACWQLAVSGLGVREYLLPSPLSVLEAMGPGEIPWTKHIWITAVEIVGAFLIAALTGVLLGAAIAWAQSVSRALTPFLVFVSNLRTVAIA